MKHFINILFVISVFSVNIYGQFDNFHRVKAEVDFSEHLHTWDGFGVNYVQTAHAKKVEPGIQEYGGFSILSPIDQNQVLEMIFGENGLKPGIVKLFLDPLHQTTPGGKFDHASTTGFMLQFASKGLELSRKRGSDLSFITTLYGPPAFCTLQKTLRGRDLDPAQRENLAAYMVDWCRYLVKERNLPLQYLSLHNEGDDWRRWPNNGRYANFDLGPDYNMFWPPAQVTDMMNLTRKKLDEKGLLQVLMTPGESSNWYRFWYWGYAQALMDQPEAIKNLGLITSHNFYNGTPGRWFSGTGNPGADLIRTVKPGVHAWVTSMSWGKMNTEFVSNIYTQIYLSRVNAIIPWAVIQRPAQWIGGDPNPGSAFKVNENGTLEILPGYYFFKQISRAGQPGMAVANTRVMDSEVSIIAFASNETKNPDAFTVINNGITATYRADAIDIAIGNGQNHRNFHFCLTDTTGNRQRNPGVEFTARQIIGGYKAYCKIPLAYFPLEADSSFALSLDLKDGENCDEGHRTWKGKLPLNTISLLKNLYVTAHDSTDSSQLDYFKEVTANAHPNTSDDFRGRFMVSGTSSHVCFEIEVDDRTNSMEREVEIGLKGTSHTMFEAYRTSDSGENYHSLGTFPVTDGKIIYNAPPKSVTTFFGK